MVYAQKNTIDPLVSICMVSYNRADYINKAIDSILLQTYSNWELIIIDDGSKDGTEQVVLSYDDARINYIKHAKNRGLHTARIASMENSNGKYIAILDSDDLWNDILKLHKQVLFLEKNTNHALVGTFIKNINSDGIVIGENTYNTTDKKIRNSILIRNQFAHSSILIRKNIYDKTIGYQDTLCEDLELFLQLGKLGMLGNIPEKMTSYRIHGGGISQNKLNMLKAIHKIILGYKHAYNYYYLALIKNYFYRLLYTLYNLIKYA
jgi:glycosyltransferase involved in cell wall biosynthesis